MHCKALPSRRCSLSPPVVVVGGRSIKMTYAGLEAMSRILDTLFVGSGTDSMDEYQLETHKITHIVRIDDDPKILKRHPGITYFLVEAYDHSNHDISQHFAAVNEFVHRARLARGVVLIHCMAGVSRSVSIAAAYLMTVAIFGRDDVLRFIKDARFQARPNHGFMRQLEKFEKEGLLNERHRIREMFSLKDGEDRLGDNRRINDRLAVMDGKKSVIVGST